MRQNSQLDAMTDKQVIERALRFYANHEYLHEDQKERVRSIADRIKRSNRD